MIVCFDGVGEGIRKEKKRKKFFFLWFSWMVGGSCFLPLSKLLGPGSCFLSSLFGPGQKRPETGWLPLLACLVCFFRWRRTSPTFQVPQRVKFLPLPTGTVLTSTCPERSQVRASKEFPTWLQAPPVGKDEMRRVAQSSCDFLFLFTRLFLMSRRFHRLLPAKALGQVTGRSQTDSN